MDISEIEILQYAEKYVALLAGGQVIEAIKFHAQKADVNLRFVKLEGLDITVAKNVFRAAHAQNKLEILTRVIQEDGFSLPFTFSTDQVANIDATVEGQLHLFEDDEYKLWIRGETEYVDIKGIGSRRPEEVLVFPILDLYTELHVQTGLSNLDLDKGRMRGTQRLSLTEMVGTTRCLLIMGDPGSGKTTFLRFVARMNINENQNFLPIYVRLADIYDYAQKAKTALNANVLSEYFIDMCNKYATHLSQQEFDEMATEGRWLWLLDSLDELSSTISREEMVRVVEEAARKWSHCKFVMTSRPLPLRGKSIPLSFERVGIADWTREEIKSFLQAWTKLLMPKASEEVRKRHWASLLATIVNRPDLRTLAKNAVMVTAMAVVHHNETKLPEGRADLLKALIYWLIRAKTRPSSSLYGEFNFIESRYRELALAMIEVEGGRRRRVGRLWAAEQISQSFNGNDETALEFLSSEEAETGVLVRRGEGDLEFWHLSFQEFLAAEEIAGKTDHEKKGWWSKIEAKLDEPEWREVIIFVPLCLNRLGSERVDLFFERLAESCVHSDLLTKARRVALGGSILRDLTLTGYKLSNCPSWDQILEDISPIFGSIQTDIPLEVRCEAAAAYGLGGDVRLRDFELTWISLHGNNFIFGAQDRDPQLPNYDQDAAPWEGPPIEVSVNDFEIRKYPITVEEFKAFIDDDGYGTRMCWTEEGWKWLTNEEQLVPLDWVEQLLAPNCPVTGVSWFEAQAYCKWLTSRDIRQIEYRLPSEVEWEYAAKHGIPRDEKFPWGNTVTPGDTSEANTAWTGLRKKTPVGIFPKCITDDGIVDMFGNVEEWCADSWTPDHLARPRDSRAIFNEAEECIVRGGSTIRFARLCRPTYRSRIAKNKRYHPVGFRPVRIWNSTEDRATDTKLVETNQIEEYLVQSGLKLIDSLAGAIQPDLKAKNYVFVESIDYADIGDESLWGPGEEETIAAIRDVPRSGRWLDLASGDGRYSKQIVKKCEKLVSLDFDEKALLKLRLRAEKFNVELTLVEANILQLPFRDSIFDVIVCTGILHLFPKEILVVLIEEIKKLIKPEGYLILDFATDIQRRYTDGRLVENENEAHYQTNEAIDIMGTLLTGYETDLKTSSFEDDLSTTEGYGYISRGKFLLVVAKKPPLETLT